ncbi:histidine kinase [Paenibacillus sp. GD4]|uniref:sensor histidine kinase n=1 Tax=Paenibacillus sp. GD4 TaxID=3068890 RepID=UPI0027964F17|nr:histidine kinase [Paenibacillus sp. GD4]MDQ1909009.1 histidine kinase [Paenibacillus sp. GD4]
MDRKVTIFTKAVVMILSILIPVVLLFAISNQTAVHVVEDEMKKNNLNKLRFLHQQMEQKIDQLSMNSIAMSNDAAIRELEYRHQSESYYDRERLLRMILDNITLQSGISGWLTDITVYSRLTKDIISTSSASVDLKEQLLINDIARGWSYATVDNGKTVNPQFVWFAVHPITAFEHPEAAKLIVKTSFSPSYLKDMLDQYKADGQGDPFLYHPKHGVLANRTVNQAGSADLINYLHSQTLEQSRLHFTVEMNGRKSLVSYLKLNNLGWYLVDSVPLEDILTPVTKTRNLFYGSTLLLLLLSVIASYVLYRNVQVPIRALVRHVQRIRKGDYSSRIELTGGTEFSFLITRFNEMTAQIQDLLEKVVAEKLRSKEAVLKQLQSQINPHFLYNCLFFIKNMARMGDVDSIEAMSLNLGDYFRYTTRLGNQSATLEEELSLITNYLEIQNLRMQRIAYDIQVPEAMRGIVVPRLMLQPLVENAILHGIEPKEGRGMVKIVGELRDNGDCRLIVTDNGIGMAPEKLAAMQLAMDRKESEEEGRFGFGLWNVNQRVKLMFGEGTGLFFFGNPEGGITSTIVLRTGRGDEHVSAVDCG